MELIPQPKNNIQNQFVYYFQIIVLSNMLMTLNPFCVFFFLNQK